MDKCWTCKVRRKKCDGRPGACENCSTLKITCYRGTKPAWMDGSTKQAEMAARFKHAVKETSRKRLVVDLTASQSMPPDLGHLDSPLHNPTAHQQAPQSTTPDVGPLNSPPLIDPALRQASQSTPPEATAPDSSAPAQGTEPQAELILSAYFLDKAHPYLCPFYQPSVDHGREWIRQLVRVSPVYRQVALCQSYLMQAKTLGSNAAAQEDKMFDMLEHAFGILSVSNIQDQLSGAVRILASVVQMQRFTLAGKSHEDHLDAAIHLFRSIVRAPTLPLAQQLSVTEHEAWRWSVGVLLMDDMISSILLDAEPRLHHYHAMMLTGWDLNLESIIGCTSNLALALGKVASLNAWTTACQQNGSLDVMQLSLEATRIESSLQTELLKPSSEDDLFPSFVSAPQRHESCKIWAHSTMVYLMLVISGRQLAKSKISTHTREATQLLQNIPTTLLPSLLWPILVVGYSTSNQRELRPVLDRLQRHRILDKVQPVVKLLEDVWTRQPQVALSQICREHDLRGFPV